MSTDEDLEFWDRAGSQLILQEELADLLNKCSGNSFVLTDGGTAMESSSGRVCRSLRFRQKEIGTVHIYCQECGIVCPVILQDESAIFPQTDADESGDELGEFLSIAGAERDDEDDDWGDDGGDDDGQIGDGAGQSAESADPDGSEP